MDIYTAALYLPESQSLSPESYMEIPKRLVFDYHLSLSKEKVTRNIRHGLKINPEVNFEKVESDFQKIARYFDPIREGDRFEFVHNPQQGIAIIKNNRTLTTIPGEDFARAFFGLWLSEYARDKKLRQSLMVNV